MSSQARLTRFTIYIVLLLSLATAFMQRQGIYDYFRLQSYTPPQRIVQLADSTTMKDDMRKVFYVNHPQLNNKTEFRNNCQATERSIVLGCFIENKGIFLLDVEDPRLNGVIEVTAAHEALHAQYERLSSKERKRIDSLTAAFYASLQDERIKKTVEQYREKDASVVPNELHSILATEVKELPPELETYYKRYFNDRTALVAYSEKYESTFIELSNQVEQYDRRLKTLKQTIESNQVEIQGLSADLEQQKARLDQLLNSGQTEAYNAAVPVFNARVNGYNALINETKGLINEYNSIVEKRNAIATAEQELIEAINSNAETRQTE